MQQHTIEFPHRHRRGTARWSMVGAPIPAKHGRHRTPIGRDSRRTGLVALAAAVVLTVAALALVTLPRATDRAPNTTPATPLAADAAVWIRTALPDGTTILAPTGTAVALAAKDIAVQPMTNDWREYDYVAAAPGDADAAPAMASSIPVAVFDDMEIRRIVADVDSVRQSRVADRADRQSAGAALLRNAAVIVGPDAKTVLADGNLDMRAASVVSELAGRVTVYLDAIVVVAAEDRAGLPARAVSIRTSDAAVAARVIDALTVAFRPDATSDGEDNRLDLRWPISLDTVPRPN